MIHFNRPPIVGTEIDYMKMAIESHKICGDGIFTKKCQQWIEERFQVPKVLLTTSGTSALEMAALLCGIMQGDEVILPSYTFTSTATAFVLAGARLVFVDIRPDTMNIDESRIEEAITERTRVICVMHYAGVACEMDKIMDIARAHNLKVVEDAAQAIGSKYKGKPLGTIGDFGCFSFHETKNLSMGEGGALLINCKDKVLSAEIIREKGTNRSQFFRGEVDKYRWIDYGSSYLPSDILAAHLWAQLEQFDKIQNRRMEIWDTYFSELSKYIDTVVLDTQFVPEYDQHNAHMFYLKFENLTRRNRYIDYMKQNDILAVFHYIPLHLSPAGEKYGIFKGEDKYTTLESDRLVRLPLYYNMTGDDLQKVIDVSKYYFEKMA